MKHVSTSSSSTGVTLKTFEVELSPSVKLNPGDARLLQALRPGVQASAEQLDVINRLRVQDAFLQTGAGTQYAHLQAANVIATANAAPILVPGP
jgi:hypothetical protein